jgi:SagB-type dehydrogenase family enzyme
MSSSTHAPLVLEYHERSKHRLNRYAPGPGRLDWANQPNPFREFEGAPRIQLPFAADNLDTRYKDVRRGALPRPRPFDLDNVAILFELALGLSAWKAYGNNRWALRCNPSSGNLHPTEGYVVCPGISRLPAGVYHYVSRDHVLEQRAAGGVAPWMEKGILVGLSSIYWREAWKYGMRAWRYCQHDCGHAIAAVSYAAAALGWQARIVLEASDEDVAELLGLDREEDFGGAEREAPDVLIWIGEKVFPPPWGRAGEGVRWFGKANRLSEGHVEWRDIDSIHRATAKPRTEVGPDSHLRGNDDLRDPEVDLSFAQIAKQRRSAVDFDGITSVSADAFFNLLACLMPRAGAPPWNALPTPPLVHPAMMVHRVDGLEPGLYVLLRDPKALEELKQAMRPEWLWQKAGPDELPLYFLLPHDLRDIAKTICCHQEIARDSCFALGMIAKLGVTQEEPWRYRHLYWECGMLGHALYLEAEAAGIRATGIGCYFDDEMHALLGIKDPAWQSLYHFTMGGAVDDPRLSTHPPYDTPWLSR